MLNVLEYANEMCAYLFSLFEVPMIEFMIIHVIAACSMSEHPRSNLPSQWDYVLSATD